MTYGHGTVDHIIKRSAARRSHSSFMTSLYQNDKKSPSKELQLFRVASGGSELRLPLFTFIFFDTNISRKVSPYLSTLPDEPRQNILKVISVYTTDCLKLQSPRMSEVDLQKSSCISSEANTLGQSGCRNKLSNSLGSSSSYNLPGCVVSGNSSGSVCDSPSVDCSDLLVNDNPKVEKRVKRNLRKKGKKKRKQYKQTSSRKVLCKKDVQCDQNIYNSVSALETSSLVVSPLDSGSSDIGEDNTDDTASQLIAKDASGLSSSEIEIISPSDELMHYDMSSDPSTVNLCNTDTEMSKNRFSCYTYLPNGFLDVCRTERADSGDEAGSSNDFHPVTSGKRGRKFRRMIGKVSANGAIRSAVANVDSSKWSNNCSVWQKVQKIGRDEDESKCSFLSSHSEVSSKDANMKKRPDKFVGLKQNECAVKYRNPCSDEVSKMKATQAASSRGPNTAYFLSKPTPRCSENSVKNKSCPAVENANQYHNNGSFPGINLQKSSQHHVQKLANLNKHVTTRVRLPSTSFSENILAKPTSNIAHNKPAQEKEINVPLEDSTPRKNVCDGDSLISLPSGNSDTCKMPTSLSQSDPIQIETYCGSSTAEYITDTWEDRPVAATEDNQCIKPDSECHQGSSGLFSHIGTPLQKWVSVGRKDSMVSDVGHCLTASVKDEAVLNLLYSEVAEGKVLSSDNSSSSAKDGQFSCLVANKSTNKLSMYSDPTKISDLIATIQSQDNQMKNKEPVRVETDLDKITKAVSDAYKLQIEVESVQLVTNSPIADLEIFLFSASPSIAGTQYSRICNSCSQEAPISDSLCWHQIPDISLKSIWQWYEEPGCFGLEVKAHDYRNSRNMRSGCLEFTAHFVPYLSAVQLFGKPRKPNYCNMDGTAGIACKLNREPRPFSLLGSSPVLTLLLPQPNKDRRRRLSGAFAVKNGFNKSTRDGEGELIFEFFESNQPPRRRPLYEKIKELVAGETPPDSFMYGDPLKLESVKLQDLHPGSWYCVAWYPIYRIPTGNFRAAFLTYHSLGHFVHRNVPASVPGSLTNIVSPVVGLQAYNDKGENWFQLRNIDSKLTQPKNALCSNTSDLMKERVRTLKHTASVMARAVVSKNNEPFVNRHPDYEFFLSRSW